MCLKIYAGSLAHILHGRKRKRGFKNEKKKLFTTLTVFALMLGMSLSSYAYSKEASIFSAANASEGKVLLIGLDLARGNMEPYDAETLKEVSGVQNATDAQGNPVNVTVAPLNNDFKSIAVNHAMHSLGNSRLPPQTSIWRAHRFQQKIGLDKETSSYYTHTKIK